MTALVHPQMMAALAGFYPSLCTLQSQASGVSAYGRKSGTWADVAGLVGLACSVNQPARSSAPQEVRRPDMTVVTEPHCIALAGYYPAVTTKMRAVVSAVTYNVLSVVHDAQHASTVLTAELVST